MRISPGEQAPATPGASPRPEFDGPSCCSGGWAIGGSAAVTRLDAFAFVGIVERWTHSICLFHATFGSTMVKGDLFNVRPGRRARDSHGPVGYDTASLRLRASEAGFEDWADHRLYAAAQAIFNRRFAAAFFGR